MSNPRRRSVDETDDEGEAFEGLPDGSGCFEIWEHLSEVREQATGD